MNHIDKNKVPLKYLIGYTNVEPTKYDMLYELVEFLQNENKDTFSESELKGKTKSRFGTYEENFTELVNEGFIVKDKYSKYKLVKHLWE